MGNRELLEAIKFSRHTTNVRKKERKEVKNICKQGVTNETRCNRAESVPKHTGLFLTINGSFGFCRNRSSPERHAK